MVPPRWLARLIIPMMAGAALVTGAAVATADPADDAYLAQLRSLGFTWPPDHDDGAHRDGAPHLRRSRVGLDV